MMIIVILLLFLVVPPLTAIGGYCFAIERNRKGWLWFINCWLSGIMGILLLAISRRLYQGTVKYTLPGDEEVRETTDTDVLGWVVFVQILITRVFLIWLLIEYVDLIKSPESMMELMEFLQDVVR